VVFFAAAIDCAIRYSAPSIRTKSCSFRCSIHLPGTRTGCKANSWYDILYEVNNNKNQNQGHFVIYFNFPTSSLLSKSSSQ
jgi:hypothetical protein